MSVIEAIAEPNSLYEAAKQRLLGTMAELEPGTLLEPPERVLRHAKDVSYWLDCDGRPLSDLEQARRSVYMGIKAVREKWSTSIYPVEVIRAGDYTESPSFEKAAQKVIEKYPDDPEVRALLLMWHGINTATKIINGRKQATEAAA